MKYPDFELGRWLLVALVVLFCGGCSGCDEDVSKNKNNRIVDVGDVLTDSDDQDSDPSDAQSDSDTGPFVNPCGGDLQLFPVGSNLGPDSPCGACNDGRIVCNGLNAVHCLGASQANACGGCGTLTGTLGQSCGACSDGELACTGLTLSCQNASLNNACGGCAGLAGEPDTACTRGALSDGLWSCINTDEVACIGEDENNCGGQEELSANPGEACGQCAQGAVVCDGFEDVRCEGEQAGVNACGGCMALLEQPGDACGACEGEWMCDGENDVICFDPDRNVCGGCTELEDHPIGEECEDEGVFSCAGLDEIVCSGSNACGGTAVLDATPGDSCGACGDGHVVCASLNLTSCIDARELNACGGCLVLSQQPGDACGEGEVWQCDDENELVCDVDPNLNACGGLDDLATEPGTACGPCNLDTFVCASLESTSCNGATVCPELTFVTEAATDIEAYAATLNATVSVLGLAPIIDHGFCWSTEEEPSLDDADCQQLGELDQATAFDLFVETLLPGRTYYVRAFLADADAYYYGNEIAFVTAAPAPTDVDATRDSSASVWITWTGIDGATGYIVYRDGVAIGQLGDEADSLEDDAAGAPGVPSAPTALSATKGVSSEVVELSWSASSVQNGQSYEYTVVATYPALSSEPSDAATGYREALAVGGYDVYRDGALLESVLVTSHTDTTASRAGVPSTPGNVTATQGTSTAHVTVSWSASTADAGTSHTYTVRAFNDAGSGAASGSDSGFLAGYGVDGYQIEINGNGSWIALGNALSYTDTAAPAATLSAVTLGASKGTSALHVVLSATGGEASAGSSVSYRVVSVNDAGLSTASSAAMGHRGVGTRAFSWDRSSTDAPSGFVRLVDTAVPTYNDATAPATGAGRYYRVTVSAAGALSQSSGSDRGFRAALPTVTTNSVDSVQAKSARAFGTITVLGAPNPTAHGFCWSTVAVPNTADCESLGASSSTDEFSALVSDLDAATTYYVRAFATTAAGTSYGENISFTTLSAVPTGLRFVTHPASAAAGASLGGVGVEVIDADGDRVSDSAASITLSITTNPAGDGVLSGTLTRQANAGLASFPGLSINRAAVGYRLGAASGALATATSNSFDISAAAPVAANSNITGTNGLADGVTAASITITLVDTYGNPVAGVVPTFSATGGGNAYGSCSATNALGVATCEMTSTQAGPKALSIATPLVKLGATISFFADSVCDPAGTLFGGGAGTIYDPFTICTAAQLNRIGLAGNAQYWNSHFKLLADINMNNVTYNRIGTGTTPFSGVFDGNFRRISNLSIPGGAENSAMFTDSTGTIRQIGLLNYIAGGGGRTAGLVGLNKGLIENSFVTGSFSSNGTGGGLVGRNEGTIRNCFSSGTASNSGNGAVGGLVGRNVAGSITNSYATNVVLGNGNVGGLVGANSATVTDSYWNVTTGSATSSGGTPLTTAQMGETSSFNASWIFAPAANHIWVMPFGGPPRLWWQ
ncbi:MAG: Ig-like domain-containing protein [Bradymonadaceae bacterium]|nr:Ig-like domain-containing protein [Lujinxingiaceae bacterium]